MPPATVAYIDLNQGCLKLLVTESIP